jgi:hypothetical protein
MYKSALDWKQMDYPGKLVNLLVDASKQGLATKEKWLGLLKFGEEWNM